MTEPAPSAKARVCPTCGKTRPSSQLVPASLIRSTVIDRMKRDLPAWDGITTCRTDVHRYRVMLLRESLAKERGGIDSLEAVVLERMTNQERLAQNVDAGPETFGARVADAVARFGGSWRFLGIFAGIIVLWMMTNIVLLTAPFDPYPFILLNLVLSCLAAVQAPVIMMSQNRHGEKDRQRAEHDYQVNLKAELEVQLLHEKLDHMMLSEWPKLLELQLLQIEMLEDGAPESRKSTPSRSPFSSEKDDKFS